MTQVAHRTIETNGKPHGVESGEGPLVVLLHGFPESWYAWRHKLCALAHAGYHAVAPDQQGYGGTDRPAEVDSYTMLDLVGDIVDVIAALGEQKQSSSVMTGMPAWHRTPRCFALTWCAASSV